MCVYVCAVLVLSWACLPFLDAVRCERLTGQTLLMSCSPGQHTQTHTHTLKHTHTHTHTRVSVPVDSETSVQPLGVIVPPSKPCSRSSAGVLVCVVWDKCPSPWRPLSPELPRATPQVITWPIITLQPVRLRNAPALWQWLIYLWPCFAKSTCLICFTYSLQPPFPSLWADHVSSDRCPSSECFFLSLRCSVSQSSSLITYFGARFHASVFCSLTSFNSLSESVWCFFFPSLQIQVI